MPSAHPGNPSLPLPPHHPQADPTIGQTFSRAGAALAGWSPGYLVSFGGVALKESNEEAGSAEGTLLPTNDVRVLYVTTSSPRGWEVYSPFTSGELTELNYGVNRWHLV